MPHYNVTATYSTVVEVELDQDGKDDEYAIIHDVLDEIDLNQGNYLWDIEKIDDGPRNGAA